jgi:hypothetical protein
MSPGRTLVRFAVRFVVLGGVALAAACGPSGGGGDDVVDGGDTGISCTGTETRCVGTQYQVCDGDTFQIAQNCPFACDATRNGCVECVPGSNACNGNQVMTCNSDGTFGSVVETCADGTECSGGMCARACTADGVDLIYVVDQTYRLVAFDPRLIGQAGGPYRVIGQLACPNPGTSLQPGGGAATPFSMAVDRDAVAWVLYSSGKLYKVSTTDASCQATPFVASQNVGGQRWDLFGMGFVTDAAGGDTEKLWIGGGNVDAQSSGSLGWIDGTSYLVNRVAAVGPTAEYSAEFTGLGDATLWAFFPDTIANAFVQQIDKVSGAGVGNRLMFDLAASGRAVQAWAFAQWGGTFYVFVTTVDALTGLNANAAVHAVNRSTGNHTIPLQNQQYVVVGAGVSTCAPITIGGPPAPAPRAEPSSSELSAN